MTGTDYASDFHREVTIDPATTALLLVDLQHASASATSGLGALLREEGSDAGQWRFERLASTVLPNVGRLLDRARRDGLTVVHLAMGSRSGDFEDVPAYLRDFARRTDNAVGRPNHRFLDEVAPRDGEVVLTKTTASAFLSTPIQQELQARGIRQLLLTGVSTNSCVESTGRDAADLGFDCFLVEDACAASTETFHAAAVANFGRLFGTITTTDDVLAALGGA